MAIKNCPECGSLHAETSDLCRCCTARVDEEFKVLAAYLREHPGIQAEQLSQGTKIPIKVILDYLTQGRLQVSRHVAFLKCGNCQTAISSGKYCEECATLMDPKALRRLRKTGNLHPEKDRRHEAGVKTKKPSK